MRLEPTRMSMVAWVEGRREQARVTTRARDMKDCIWGDWLSHFYFWGGLLAHLTHLEDWLALLTHLGDWLRHLRGHLGGLANKSYTSEGTG